MINASLKSAKGGMIQVPYMIPGGSLPLPRAPGERKNGLCTCVYIEFLCGNPGIRLMYATLPLLRCIQASGRFVPSLDAREPISQHLFWQFNRLDRQHTCHLGPLLSIPILRRSPTLSALARYVMVPECSRVPRCIHRAVLRSVALPSDVFGRFRKRSFGENIGYSFAEWREPRARRLREILRSLKTQCPQ